MIKPSCPTSSRQFIYTILGLLLFVAAPIAHASEPGDVAWFDLVTEDAEAAVAFYSEMFGWTIAESDNGGKLMLHKGLPFAGIEDIEDNVKGVSESQWIPVIIVEDVEAATRTARRSGGTVEQIATRVAGALTYSVVRDTENATIVLASTEQPLGNNEGAGSWVWAELWTDDIDKAATFYEAVVGYTHDSVPDGDAEHPVFDMNDELKAGMVLIPYEGVTPAWAPYIGILDMNETLTRARRLGAEVFLSPEEASDSGRVALLGDPQGAAFFVYELESP